MSSIQSGAHPGDGARASSFRWRITRGQIRRLIEDRPGVVTETAEDVESDRAQRILGLAMGIAESMLASGAAANDVDVAMLRVANAYGLRHVHVDVTFTSITMTWHRTDRDPLTTMRVLRTRSTDYNRLHRAEELVREVESGLPLERATDRLAAIERAPHPYRPWVVMLAYGMVALGVALLSGGAPQLLALTFLSSCLIYLVTRALFGLKMPAFFRQVAGAAVPTLFAFVITWAQGYGLFEGIRPTLLVTSGIVMLLAGVSAVGAAQDSIDEFFVTAAARTLEVLMLTLGIVAGILAVLSIGARFGMALRLSPVGFVEGPWWAQILGALLTGLGFAVASFARPRTVLLASLSALLGWTIYQLAGLGFGPIGSSALGAFAVAVIGTLVARRARVAALALISSGLVPLVPGGALFRGVLQITGTQTTAEGLQGIFTLMTAAGIGLALAAGASLGSYLARPLDLATWGRRRRGPAADPAPEAP